jgi:hypothetical protein
MLKRSLFILLLCGSSFCFSQETFSIDKDRKNTRIKFELVNNLIIVPVELNGLNLTFLVDTGVKTTLLLNLNEKDTLDFNWAEKLHLRGLGGEELIEAYSSPDNELRIGKVSHSALTVFIVYDEKINFSPRLGVPVHGIIGYDMFKDFVVEINYSRKFIRLHDPSRFRKNLKRYDTVPLQFFQGKPYVNTVIDIEDKEIPATLLLDNGLSDALWLFPDNVDVRVPKRSFEDFLGLGLLGDVYGQRGKIQELKIGNTTMSGVTASFPDSLSVEGLQTYELRKGSIGGEIMRRFHVIFDYKNQELHLRRNKWFLDPYHYDMSGIVLEHSGFVMVETYEKIMDPVIPGSAEDNLLIMEPAFYKKFQLKPAFRIARLREDSPAVQAGLQEGDEVVKVNGRKSYKMGLDDFTRLFSSEEGKLIKMEVERAGRIIKVSFRLKSPLTQ